MFARKLLRALFMACLASFVGVVATATVSTPAHIDSVDAWVVRNGQLISIKGSNFTNFGTADCTTGTAPQVNFLDMQGNPLNPPQTVAPKSNDSTNCTDTMIKTTVPAAISGATRVQVIDGAGKASNNNLELTIQPTADTSNRVGGIGSGVTITGSNLRPPTVVQSQASLSFAGATRSVGWAPDGSVTFSPGQGSGSIQLDFDVHIDAANAASTVHVSVPAGSFTFQPPSLAGGALPRTTVGKVVNLSGSWLGANAGSVTFSGGGASVTASVVRGNWTDSAISVAVPAGAPTQSTLTVTVPGYGSAQAPSGPPTLTLDPTYQSTSPTSGSSGAFITVNGYNFGSSPGSVLVAGTVQQGLRWADKAVGFSIDPSTESGSIVVNRADGATLTAGTLTIVPQLTRLETSTVGPGAPVVVDGVSFGATRGTLMLGSQVVPSQLWSRSSILFTVPAGTAPGHYNVLAVTSAGVRSNPLALNVTTQPSPTPLPASSASATTIGGVHVYFDNAHQFVKPPKGSSPVDLTVSADPKKLAAGGTANITVTLLLNGKPVPDAKVDLSMVKSAGSDYEFLPASGTTDNNGVFKATVKISKTPGDNIILAQSGVFSDQDDVVGTGKNGSTAAPGAIGSTTSRSRGSLGALLPLIGLGVVAAALVAGGLFLNLRSHG